MDAAEESDIERARTLMDAMNRGGRGQALLSTVTVLGEPHATWMGAWLPGGGQEVLTITSPDSKKIRNIRANPKVEWLFGENSREGLLYLTGAAEVLEGVAEIKRCWNSLPRKEESFFMRFYNSGLGFAIIRTRIEMAVLVYPEQCRKVLIPLDALSPEN